MTTQSSLHSDKPIDQDINYWQRASRLESGRAEILRHVAQGDTLADILNLLCKKAEEYNPDMMCSVLALDEEHSTLHPIASTTLPNDYCAALEGVTIGLGVGSCGTAAFLKQRVVVEDINTHPYWAQYRALALGAGLQACWSEPIIGSAGKVFGTFAMYYAQPRSPIEEDIQFIETNANLAAIVFENNLTRKNLITANTLLSQTVDERNQQLMQTNAELSSVLVQQALDNSQSLKEEKLKTTKKLLVGFAHEINTPVGIAMTSTSFTLDIVDNVIAAINNNKLSRPQALKDLNDMKESLELTAKSLKKTALLIDQFREIDICFSDSNKSQFLVDELLQDFSDSIQPQLGAHTLSFEVEPETHCHSKSALWQVLSQLVDNSIEHGFKDLTSGSIGIHASQNQETLIINYQDNGIGISEQERNSVFEPFFSTQRESGKVGLGLNIINNTISNTYKGQIQLVDSPIGVRYEIIIPLSS
ncbi:MAG: GAF domain-containing sensor histidine kinase [Oleispira antarctica]|uniref:histidine kinase n=1 Tax=Oleispira antarctica RB-8 TaxID=698738 RepID=R4YKF5_OLEAN|nr:GAF domain-containing sensor histidine kinase [Oleispira antarctica]MBQ0794094.1 GAF domain-containing sensor histidine kinase [Oleispira antarctica]CCK74755.1 sensor protein [Oleispira antarctica RB-8]|tara:strand:+ start:1202 stop:2626 length:1425 start_codon:yes stop_codon:yes gene_type:complete